MGIKGKSKGKRKSSEQPQQPEPEPQQQQQPITNETTTTNTNNNDNNNHDAEFLPLEGGPAWKLVKRGGGRGEEVESKATVLYIGRIPHGFYEDQMEGFFKQFGTIKRLKLARNRKTGKSKHYGFIEFEFPEVARIVADCMHNHLLYEHMLQVYPIPPERVHPKLWRAVNRRYLTPVDFVEIERRKHNKERTLEEQQKMLKTILKRDKKRRMKIKAAGIDYECPKIEGADQPAPKKIRF